MAFIQGGFNAGQNPFINQFPTSFGAPAFGGAQQSFGFNPQQAQMMFMLQALMQAMQQMYRWHTLGKPMQVKHMILRGPD